jgi:hypothetical protein
MDFGALFPANPVRSLVVEQGIELAIQTSTVVADEFDVAYFLTI